LKGFFFYEKKKLLFLHAILSKKICIWFHHLSVLFSSDSGYPEPDKQSICVSVIGSFRAHKMDRKIFFLYVIWHVRHANIGTLIKHKIDQTSQIFRFNRHVWPLYQTHVLRIIWSSSCCCWCDWLKWKKSVWSFISPFEHWCFWMFLFTHSHSLRNYSFV
jgi:hypothetical protein